MIQGMFPALFRSGPNQVATRPFFRGSSLANALAWASYNERND